MSITLIKLLFPAVIIAPPVAKSPCARSASAIEFGQSLKRELFDARTAASWRNSRGSFRERPQYQFRVSLARKALSSRTMGGRTMCPPSLSFRLSPLDSKFRASSPTVDEITNLRAKNSTDRSSSLRLFGTTSLDLSLCRDSLRIMTAVSRFCPAQSLNSAL